MICHGSTVSSCLTLFPLHPISLYFECSYSQRRWLFIVQGEFEYGQEPDDIWYHTFEVKINQTLKICTKNKLSSKFTSQKQYVPLKHWLWIHAIAHFCRYGFVGAPAHSLFSYWRCLLLHNQQDSWVAATRPTNFKIFTVLSFIEEFVGLCSKGVKLISFLGWPADFVHNSKIEIPKSFRCSGIVGPIIEAPKKMT